MGAKDLLIPENRWGSTSKTFTSLEARNIPVKDLDSKNAVAIIVVVAAAAATVIIVVAGVYPVPASRSSLSSSSPLPIDNIQCNTMEPVFHIHAHMDIIINGYILQSRFK